MSTSYKVSVIKLVARRRKVYTGKKSWIKLHNKRSYTVLKVDTSSQRKLQYILKKYSHTLLLSLTIAEFRVSMWCLFLVKKEKSIWDFNTSVLVVYFEGDSSFAIFLWLGRARRLSSSPFSVCAWPRSMGHTKCIHGVKLRVVTEGRYYQNLALRTG